MIPISRQRLMYGGVGALLVMIGTAYLLSGKGSKVPMAVNRDSTEAPKPASQHETDKPRDAGLRSAADDPCEFFELVSDDIMKKLRPVEWTRSKFDGKSLYFSPGDQAKAENILSRYGDNFARISRLEMTATSKRTLLDQSYNPQEEPKAGKNPLANCTLRIEAVRSPQYFKMKGQSEDGYKIEEIVTPAGEMSGENRTFGHAASLIPTYLDGDLLFIPASLLKYGHRVLDDRVMDLDIPVLKDALGKMGIADRRYDVIVQEKDEGFNCTFWFNRATGMLDFNVAEWREKKSGQSSFLSAAILDYYCVDGVYYYRDVVIYDCDCKVKSEKCVTNLILNGKPAE